MIALDAVINDALLLAPLPPAASRLARIAQDRDADISEVVTVVRYDPELPSQLLAYANANRSPALTPLTHVRDAIVCLGIPKVLEIAVIEHLGTPMMEPIPAYGLQEGELWEHSTAAALAAEILGQISGDAVPPASILAALLHDIGKLVLAPHLEPKATMAIARAVDERGMVYSQAELEVVGFTHALVGARIAEIWNLDEQVAAAIRRHHELDTDHGPIADAVRVGNLVAKTLGRGLGDEGLNLAADAAAYHRLGISRQDFEMVCAEVLARFHEVDRIRPHAA
ncbi:MAG: HDOD domain-containing protein [Candidatus Eisenbacteria sp.]|nr:HDOD domain-containing protein [Candidatus Eisenbacteria bacterium]